MDSRPPPPPTSIPGPGRPLDEAPPPAAPTPGGPGYTTTEFFTALAAFLYVVANRIWGDPSFAAQLSSALVSLIAIGYALARGIAKKGAK